MKNSLKNICSLGFGLFALSLLFGVQMPAQATNLVCSEQCFLQANTCKKTSCVNKCQSNFDCNYKCTIDCDTQETQCNRNCPNS